MVFDNAGKELVKADKSLAVFEKARQLARAVSAACNSTWAVSVGEVQRNDAAPSELAIAIRTPDGQLDTHTHYDLQAALPAPRLG